MTSSISERSEQALLSLFPRAQGRANAGSWLVDQLVDAELHRVGVPDSTSGAFHALALTQGTLLKEEYDLSTHGHSDEWALGAVLVDALELTLFNMTYGFDAGDQALKAMVSAMKATHPNAKVVRIHVDAFAVVFGPTAQQRVSASFVEPLREAMSRAVKAVTPASTSGVPRPLGFTIGTMELTVVDPPNWQVLGPLAWAEFERALVVAKRQPFHDVLHRRVVLGGRLPEFD